MITYEALRKAVSEEKANNRLSKLPEGFFNEVKDYLEKKAKLHEKEDKWELDSARNTLEDLLEVRERKVLMSALFGSRTGVIPENMILAERTFFDKVVDLIKDFRQGKEKEMETGPIMTDVEFIEDVAAFVGIDMENYGPFKKGDNAPIPKENARLLMKKGSAKPPESEGKTNTEKALEEATEKKPAEEKPKKEEKKEAAPDNPE